jgi:hypothetical protein
MKLHRWNGERWWVDDKGLLKRIALWVLWPGGWQTFTTWPLRERVKPHYWTPFSLFGHRLTFFGWGVQWRVKGGYCVLSGLNHPERPARIYWSPDGTPDRATVWFWRAPKTVQHAAAEAQREADSRLRSVA